MTKKELWEDVQKNDVEFKDFVLKLVDAFGKVELMSYEREDIKYENNID